MARPTSINARDFVASLARGLEVISAFGEDNPAMSLSQVAQRTGLTRAGARRFLLTLLDLGYVARDDRLFRLTPKVLSLGYAYLGSLPISHIAQPFLEEVTARTGESCSLGLLDGTDVVYVARSTAKRLLMVGIHVGTRFPAHITSMGRVLLANLDAAALDAYLAGAHYEKRTPRTLTDEGAIREEIGRVRRQGYSLLDQELEVGIRSVAVPVRARAGCAAIAAINISTHASSVPRERLLKDYLALLQQTAGAIAAAVPR